VTSQQLPGGERVIELPATAAASGLARRELTATPGIHGDLGYKALLLCSELIAVCVQDVPPDVHATIRLTIAVSDERVRIVVAGRPVDVPIDDSLHSLETPSLGGYGLRIVDRMADAWGVQDDAGTTIWFELQRT
jgi:hypothetical protein